MRRTAKRRRLCLGAHLSAAGGVSRAIERAQELGVESLQIFTKNANRWEQKPIPPGEIARFRALRSEWGEDHPVASHDSYLINLASADPALWRRSLAALADELRRAESLGLDFLVMHPGAHVGAGVARGVERVARGLRRLFAKVRPGATRVLLENTAGQGTTLGRSFRELAGILDRVETTDRIGVCLDTCHLFAAGYDLRGSAAYSRVMAELEEEIGSERVFLLHLNDSRGVLGSRLDRHENIGEGRLGTGAFRRLLRDPRFFGVPKVIETPKANDMDRINLALLHRLG